MKVKLITFTILASSALAAFSQGTVNYNNIAGTKLSPIIIAPAHPNDQVQGQSTVAIGGSAPLGTADYGAGAVAASGTGFSAQLWAGADANSLSAVNGSLTKLRGGAFAGYITAIATLPIPQIALGGSGTLQLRAWNNANNTITTWQDALNAFAVSGVSAPWVQASTGGVGTPASPPVALTQLTSFNLFAPVPEPSLIALGALGLGALLLRRRKA